MIRYIVTIKDEGKGNCSVTCTPETEKPTDPEIACATGVKQRIDTALNTLGEAPSTTVNPKRFTKKY